MLFIYNGRRLSSTRCNVIIIIVIPSLMAVYGLIVKFALSFPLLKSSSQVPRFYFKVIRKAQIVGNQ